MFYQEAPGDKDDGWARGRQYPRVTCLINMQADPKRQNSGQLYVNIWCDSTGITPEDIEPLVRRSLQGVFLTPEGGRPHCMSWASSEGFEIKEQESNQRTQVIGVTVTFDIFAFTRQLQTDPDPIIAINEYTRVVLPGCRIIAYDDLPAIYMPTAQAPAVYWSIDRTENERTSWAVAWMASRLSGHIFAPEPEDRLELLQTFVQTAAADEETVMADGSPMFFMRITADSGADHLRTGQLALGTRYGVLRTHVREGHKYELINKYINERKNDNG